jgi:hypothetical protein
MPPKTRSFTKLDAEAERRRYIRSRNEAARVPFPTPEDRRRYTHNVLLKIAATRRKIAAAREARRRTQEERPLVSRKDMKEGGKKGRKEGRKRGRSSKEGRKKGGQERKHLVRC